MTLKPEMNMSSSVHVNQAILIIPSRPTPNCILPLSAIDSQLFLRFTFEYLLVFKPRHGSPLDMVAITRNLRSALGQVLVTYYPLTGRVRRRADGKGLEVVCRGQGALFIEAVSDCTLSEFNGAPTCPTKWREFLALHVEDVLAGAPPLVVQLTWLLDGGAALAFGFNHCLCDGVGSGEFLNSLSELAVGKRQPIELSPKPVWNRCLLNLRPSGLTRGKSSSHPEFGVVPDISQFSSRYVRERLVPTCTVFDKNKVDELKKLAKSTYNKTSFEVLAAHIWRSWARSLNLVPDQTVKLVFSVNIRQRVNPRLPNGYYGNAIVLGCAQTSVRNLTQRDLRHAVELVVKAKERVGEEYVREVVELVSWNGASVDSVGTLIMTQWTRLGLDQVDIGMGRPVHVGPVCCDKYCILSPVSEEAGAVKVDLAMPSGSVDQFLNFLTSTRGWGK